MPKHKIDGTHMAVTTPSARCPVNQRNADNPNDMETASKIKRSDFWNIEFSSWVIKMGDIKVSYSIEPSAARRQPMIAKRAIEWTVDSPTIKFSGNWMNPPTMAITIIAVPISRAIPRTKSVRLARRIRARFIALAMNTRWDKSFWVPSVWVSRLKLLYWLIPCFITPLI